MTEEEEEDEEEAISVDAAAAVLSELAAIFTLKEERRTAVRAKGQL